MALKVFCVDTCTSIPHVGYEAAVCLLTEEKGTTWRQGLATELNLPATAFLLRADGSYKLRWFTPKIELHLCGHATLASAHVLYETGLLKTSEQARFYAYNGLLTAQLNEFNWIERRLPANPQGAMSQAPAPPGLLEGLGVVPRFVGTNKMDWLVEVEDEEMVRNLQPNFAVLASIRARGIIVTSAGKGDYDFVSRLFAPRAGVDEDPICESSYCGLGPYWSKILGKQELVAVHASGGGGMVRVSVVAERVHVSGQAKTRLSGEIVNDLPKFSGCL